MRCNNSGKCDIVIPVWNNLDLTRDCIDSITEYTRYSYRIILIDNASDTPTKRYLDLLKERLSDAVEIIRNQENRGFIRAVNQGMKRSGTPYICIMNNDTLVTEGWLGEMIDVLLSNDAIGIINPSSNTSCQFPGKLDIHTYARSLKHFKGKHQELYTCRAFAMVVKRCVIESVGYLDERYGMGYFDDTDYCKRAQKAGFRTVRAKASYVYHKESQSFAKIDRRNSIFAENEKKFISKWGKQLRVAYVLPGPGCPEETKRASSNINNIATAGHQVWIFTKAGIKAKLNLIDHENIRFYCYPRLFFNAVVVYKIWKRKRKKSLNIILANGAFFCYLPKAIKKNLKADIIGDYDFTAIEEKLNEMSGAPSEKAGIAGV